MKNLRDFINIVEANERINEEPASKLRRWLENPIYQTIPAWMGGYDNEKFSDPNDTEGATVPADKIQWGHIGMAGFIGRSATKREGRWYTVPGTDLVDLPQAIEFLEKAAMVQRGTDLKKYVDPQNVPASTAGSSMPGETNIDKLVASSYGIEEPERASASTTLAQQPPAQASTTTATQPTPKEGDRSKSKTGKDIIYHNNEWVYLK